jgi:hypothetical protein
MNRITEYPTSEQVEKANLEKIRQLYCWLRAPETDEETFLVLLISNRYHELTHPARFVEEKDE